MTNFRDLLLLPFKILQRIFSPEPVFTEIAIPVPQPLGLTNLPDNIYFDVHTNFTPAQVQLLRDTISGVLQYWAVHMSQRWAGGTNTGVSQLAACANTYATRNLEPIWHQGPPITNGAMATNVAMNQLTRMIRDNGFRRAPRARITPRSTGTVFATTAISQNTIPLSFSVNMANFQRPDVNAAIRQGSIFHAFLHRAGFYDPKTSTYFISEAPMCVIRGYQPKVPGFNDANFYNFFD
ncbi:hypothetical protein [Mesobacillus foraminis]|uniref:hypothetical protein n=1 Tax=Mesobacillus foraminis TaxID=279826 RepID=UPI000EF44C72|nr:hypothetical protein [Mesobacillus foraminis]